MDKILIIFKLIFFQFFYSAQELNSKLVNSNDCNMHD